MKYYKIINESHFVGVGTTNDLRRWQRKHNIMLSCEENEAQYIQCNDECYHAAWMVPETKENSEYITLDVIEIDKDEYDTLFAMIENNEEIPPIEEEIIPPADEYIEPSEESTIEFAIASKIAEMSNTCNKVISKGFDVVLSDNETHHYSLTTQDQSNLLVAKQELLSGNDAFMYHADGELYKYYSKEDIEKIIVCADYFKAYHLAYYNSLKAYIHTLKECVEVGNIFYGVEIPKEYLSDVLVVLMNKEELFNELL